MFSFIHVLYLTLFYVNIYCIAMYTVAILCMLCLCLMGLWPSGYYWINVCAWSIAEAGVFFRSSGMFVIRLGRFVFVRLYVQYRYSSHHLQRPLQDRSKSSAVHLFHGQMDGEYWLTPRLEKSPVAAWSANIFMLLRGVSAFARWSGHCIVNCRPLVHDEDPLVTDALGHSSTLRDRSPDGF